MESKASRQVGLRADMDVWPALPWTAWKDTAATLHLWMQVVGKIKLALATRVNHWWHVPLLLTARGLTTASLPYGHHRLQIDFDFVSHRLVFLTSTGQEEVIPLAAMPVAEFYSKVMATLDKLDFPVHIWTLPVEIPDAIPFERDYEHRSYDPEAVNRFWRILLQAESVFTAFRSYFIGKVSPVHFFWGSFDLAVTRFSGKRAPVHPTVPHIADPVVQSAYSHEVSSCGFWPGGPNLPEPIFFAYGYPAPPGLQDAPIRPDPASFNETLAEFVLPYEAIRQMQHPEQYILEFLQSAYEGVANLGHWDRESLERSNDQIF